MQFPVIHLNGTSKKPLIEQNLAIYHLISSDAINVAYAEHIERLNAIQNVADEAISIASYIDSQGKRD